MAGTLINHRRFSKTHFSHLFIFLFLGWRVCWGSENFAPSCQQKFLSSFPVCGTALYLTYRVQLIFMNESLLFDECRFSVQKEAPLASFDKRDRSIERVFWAEFVNVYEMWEY